MLSKKKHPGGRLAENYQVAQNMGLVKGKNIMGVGQKRIYSTLKNGKKGK